MKEARETLNEFAKEIHYITGSGIDKIVLKSGRSKIDELVLGLAPHEKLRRFDLALKFSFNPICTYRWQNENGAAQWRIREEEISDGWQRTLYVRPFMTKSFNLPCATGHRTAPNETQNPFVFFSSFTKRRRGTIGWSMHYDYHDPVLKSFLARFWEDGNLALGDKRYFGMESRTSRISGTFIAPEKVQRPRIPRRSHLASQPADDTDYVYVIRMGRKNMFKIGKTNDPQGRLTSLQTASPFKLSLTNVFRADNASAAEEALHAALIELQMEGEWFSLTNEQKEALASVDRFQDGKFIIGSRAVTVEELLKR